MFALRDTRGIVMNAHHPNPAVVWASVALVAVLVYAAAHIRDQRSIDETAGRTRLVEALSQTGESGARSPFEDVLVTLHLPHSDVHVSDGKGQDDKYFALPLLQRKGRDCVVYAAGLAGEARFEMMLSDSTPDVKYMDSTAHSDPLSPSGNLNSMMGVLGRSGALRAIHTKCKRLTPGKILSSSPFQ